MSFASRDNDMEEELLEDFSNIDLYPEIPQSRNRKPTIWSRRVDFLRDHHGLWVDATNAWGTKQGSVGYIRARYHLEINMRNINGEPHVFLRSPVLSVGVDSYPDGINVVSMNLPA